MTALEQFLDTRQTLCDIFCRCDTAGMEGTHGQLCTRLTDGLCGDNADCLTDRYQVAVCQVCAIALCADTLSCTAHEDGTDLDALYAAVHNLLCVCLGEHLVFGDDEFAGLRITQIVYQITADQTLGQLFDQLVAIADLVDLQTVGCAAVLFPDDDILRNVYQTTGQITRVGGTQCRICQTLTGATGGDEVFQDIQTLTIVGTNRHFDGRTGSIGDQTTHTSQLTNLRDTTTGTGVRHHEDGVVPIQTVLQRSGNVVGCLVPDFDEPLGLFRSGDITILVLRGDLIDLCICGVDDIPFFLRDDGVADSNGDGCLGGILESGCLDLIQHFRSGGSAVDLDAAVNDLTQLLFADQECDFQIELLVGIGTVYITQILGDIFVEDQTADGAVDDLGYPLFADILGDADFDLRMDGNVAFLICHQCLVYITEYLALALFAVFFHGQIVRTQNHILCRYGYRTSVRRFQQVVGSQHQETCLSLCLSGQRQMHCHLVAVEVGVECGAYQRMQFQRTALYQNRLECLDTQTVQRRRTVQQNRMIVDDIFQRIPYFRRRTVYHLSCALDVCNDLGVHQTFQHERLEQFQRHFLRQTALIHFQLRSDNDYRTTGIVNTLTQQVLTETSLLTFQHIRQGLQRTVVRTGDRSAVSAVVDKGIDCLLEHTLFIADNDLRCIQFQHTFQTIVTVDDPAIQIVQVRCGISAAVQHDHRAQIRRNDRNNVHNHPFRTVAGLTECLYDLQAFQQLDTLLTGCQTCQLCFQFCCQFIQVDLFQQFLDRLSAHACLKFVAVLFPICVIFLIGQQLFRHQFCVARIQDNELSEVQHFFQTFLGDLQHLSDTGRSTLKVPDVRDRRCQLDVTHTLTAYLCTGDFYAAAVADLTLKANLLKLTAVALPVLCRSENALTVQTVTLRLLGTIVDGLRALYCTIGPLPDAIRRSKTNLNRFKSVKFQTVTS